MDDEQRELLNLRAIEISLRSAVTHAPHSRDALVDRAGELYGAARSRASTQRVRDEIDRLQRAADDGAKSGGKGGQ